MEESSRKFLGIKGNGVGWILATLATLIWSGNFIVARGLKEVIPPVTMSVLRWGVAAVILFPFAWKQLREDWPMIRAQWKLLLPISFFGITAFNTLLYQAAHDTEVINMSLIAISGPLFVVTLNRLLYKESISSIKVIGFLVVITGLLFLLTKGHLERLLQLTFSRGDLFMALGALLFSIYTVLLRKKNPKIRMGSTLLFLFISGTLMLFPFWYWELSVYTKKIPIDGSTIPGILYIAVLAALASYYCWNSAVAKIGSTNTAAIYNLLPFFSALAAALLLGEKLMMVQVFSGIIILAGVFLITTGEKMQFLLRRKKSGA